MRLHAIAHLVVRVLQRAGVEDRKNRLVLLVLVQIVLAKDEYALEVNCKCTTCRTPTYLHNTCPYGVAVIGSSANIKSYSFEPHIYRH